MFFDNSQFFKHVGEISTHNGNLVQVYQFMSESLNEDNLTKWAVGLRNHYVQEKELKSLPNGTGLSEEEYIEQYIFPDPMDNLGAATMSGEFGEILVNDYINFVQKYYVSRTKYIGKPVRNNPLPGCDVIGYKSENPNEGNEDDQLIVAEVKTRSSTNGSKEDLCKKTVQDSIEHSRKDLKRLAESLNAEKRRLLNFERYEEANLVQRFQNKPECPYKTEYFAVAVLDSDLYSEKVIKNVLDEQATNESPTQLLIIHSKELKSFLRDLYRRASSCQLGKNLKNI